MPACDGCAHSGTDLSGECCNSIYHNLLGRDDDNDDGDDTVNEVCFDLNEGCNPGTGHCYPGLTCGASKTCQSQTDNPEAHAATASLVMSFPSLISNITNGGRSFVSVGLLGAVMIVMTVALQCRHRGVLLRRHQYSEVDAYGCLMNR